MGVTTFEELEKNELKELLYILLDQKNTLWEFHPKNPNKVSLDEKYNEIEKDIERILNLLEQ